MTLQHITEFRKDVSSPNFMKKLMLKISRGNLKMLSKSSLNKNMGWKISVLSKVVFAQDIAVATALANRLKDIALAFEACVATAFVTHYHIDGSYDHVRYADDIIDALTGEADADGMDG